MLRRALAVACSAWAIACLVTLPPAHLALRLGFLAARERLVASARVVDVRAGDPDGRIGYAAEWGDGADVLFYVHGGWWMQYDLFAVPGSAQAIARAHNLTLVSVSYRLFSHGATLDEMRADLRAAWEHAVRARPRARIVAMGSSAGGTLLLDAVREGIVRPDAVVIDSASTCVPRVPEDVAASDVAVWTRLHGAATSPAAHPESPLPRLRGVCFDGWTPKVPTLALHSTRDAIVPYAQSRRWIDSATTANLAACVAPYGQHMATLGPREAACVRAWVEGVLGRPAARPRAYHVAALDVVFSEALRLVPAMERRALCNTHPYSRWIYEGFCEPGRR